MSASRREHLNALQMIYEPQREIGARDRIEVAQIVRARAVSWDEVTGRKVLVGQCVDNPHYDADRYRFSQMSTDLYPFHPTLREIIGIASTVAFYAESWCIGSEGTMPRSANEIVCSGAGPIVIHRQRGADEPAGQGQVFPLQRSVSLSPTHDTGPAQAPFFIASPPAHSQCRSPCRHNQCDCPTPRWAVG